jgi:CRISPR-associated protein Cas2
MFVTGYRSMWLLVMFDLPTDTKKARRDYAIFRKKLLEDGFQKMQYSIYLRHCASIENAEVHVARVHRNLPPEGEIRIMSVTDKQFERMEIFLGKLRQNPEMAPPQLLLF